MVKLDRQSHKDKYEGHFGFSILPHYSFSQLLFAFSDATWLGRCVYLLTHLVGAVPFMSAILESAHRVFAKMGIVENTYDPIQAAQVSSKDQLNDGGSSSSQKGNMRQSYDVYDLNEDPEEIRPNPDFAIARLLQEVVDAEEARRLQQELDAPAESPHSPNHVVMDEEADAHLAMKLQADLDLESANELHANS